MAAQLRLKFGGQPHRRDLVTNRLNFVWLSFD
jgi:hypothetical protein